jgi:hypothetical protein
LVRVLPFNKRKKADEIELDDADIVVLEEAAVEIDVADLEIDEAAAAKNDAQLAELAEDRPQLPRVSSPPKASLRRLVAPRDRFEDDVADECLKSIAAATARTRLSDSFPASIVPAAPRVPHFESPVDELLAEAPLPQFELSDTDETTRRPALSSSSVMPIARDSVPGVLPGLPPAPMSVSSLPTPVFSRTTSSPHLPAASSIAPVAMTSTPGPVEPTVILVRQPPKAAWVVAAAFLGAACALLGMRILTRSADPPPTIVVTAPPPPPQVAPAAPPPPPATVRFADEQAVAVVAAPPTTASAPPPPKPVVTTAAVKTASPAIVAAPPPAPAKPAPKASSLGPKLPDGSMALTKSPSAPSAQPAAAAQPAPAPAPQPAPAPASPRKLTPEQQLAEAQLKASMK